MIWVKIFIDMIRKLIKEELNRVVEGKLHPDLHGVYSNTIGPLFDEYVLTTYKRPKEQLTNILTKILKELIEKAEDVIIYSEIKGPTWDDISENPGFSDVNLEYVYPVIFNFSENMGLSPKESAEIVKKWLEEYRYSLLKKEFNHPD